MSDAISSPTALDPERPWIQSEEELPSRMNWMDTFFNPLGESPKLHFTRAWTVLFFTGLLSWVGLGFAIFVVGVAGLDTAGLSVFHAYLIAVVLGVSCILSFIIHARRLNHAKKSSVRAVILLVPLALGAVAFMGSMSSKSAEYDKLYEARAEYLADPAAWRENRLEERREAQAKAEQERLEREAAEARGEEVEEQSGNRGGQRGGPPGGGNGPSPENPLPSKEAFILQPSLGAFYTPIALLNALIMIWSLTWVARVPNFSRKNEVADPDNLFA